VGGRLPWLGETFFAGPVGAGAADTAGLEADSFATASAASVGVGGTLGRPEMGMSLFEVGRGSIDWVMGG
jgi:hypothetical protein